ncbi:MAG: arsenic efflux protein [Lachnospiraceae bacterium]|nr:arsenic efflux protein [Lachnospiraceae bacterium]
MLDVLLDSLIDCVKLLPFLFLSYLAVEYIEHRMSDRSREWIYRAGKAGPLLGSLIGVIPQCGFSAAAAGLFAAGIVSPGTLLAVFLSTSDEMMPIMLSEGIHPGVIFRILAAKVVAGALVGLLVDFAAAQLNLWRPARSERLRIFPKARRNGNRPVAAGSAGSRPEAAQAETAHSAKTQAPPMRDARNGSGKMTSPPYAVRSNEGTSGKSRRTSGKRFRLVPGETEHRPRQHMCEQDHCHCSEDGIFRAALRHTAQTAAFLFLISLALGFGMEWFEGTAFSRRVFSIPGIQAAIAALIGLIPNCAASVLITELYLEGILSSGALFAGLLCGAGTGLLVLFRENRNRRENLALMLTLYASGLLMGGLIGIINTL